jgi:plasmid stabilization system protein ParE
LLADYPEMGRDRSDEWGLGRRSLVAGEYVIVYRIDDGDVIILRVFHGRQDIDSVLI